jgi:hypothetical protein
MDYSTACICCGNVSTELPISSGQLAWWALVNHRALSVTYLEAVVQLHSIHAAVEVLARDAARNVNATVHRLVQNIQRRLYGGSTITCAHSTNR